MAAYYYCRHCKKFTRTASFSFTCTVCKNKFATTDQIPLYYNENKNKPNFAELEANYENYLEEYKVKSKEQKTKLKEQEAKSKERKEKLKNNITTSDTITGKDIVEILGVFNGSDSYNPAGLLREGYGKMGNIYMQGAIDNATDKMISAAAHKDADAIISFKTTTSNAGLNNILVTVTGTAVKVKDSDSVTNSKTMISAADEILKYKQLLDSGIITQEEFETKKKQLLNLQ